MNEQKALTRADLDRMKLEVAKQVGANQAMLLGCPNHPKAGNTVIYEDGCLRLLCGGCGFQTARVKVADGEV